MTFTRRAGLELAGAALAAFLFMNWLAAHQANVRAEAVQQANERVIAANAAQLKANADEVKGLRDELALLKTDQTAKLATVAATFARAATPTDVSALVEKLMTLQKPVVVTTPAPTAENSHPTPVAAVPIEDVPQVKAYLQACEECKVNLKSVTAQLANVTAQLAAADRDRQALASTVVETTQQRDRWRDAARGGSFWQRAKHAGKWALIGGGAAVVALCAAGHCQR